MILPFTSKLRVMMPVEQPTEPVVPESTRSTFVEKATTTTEYRYAPFLVAEGVGEDRDSKWFRLLCLLPGDPSDSICAHLHAYPLTNAPEYEALSYCWNHVTEKAAIQIDGSTLHVTASVAEALRHLRHRKNPRLFWVDQICIDQQNLKERAYQVALMREIYMYSAKTIAWLGPDDDQTEMAFESIGRLSEILVGLNDSGVDFARPANSTELAGKYGLSATPSYLSDKRLSALVRLIQNQYFNRIWIVQEIAVSRVPMLRQGKFEKPFESMMAAAVLMIGLRLLIFASDETLRHAMNIAQIAEMRTYFGREQSISLFRLLSMFRESKATDLRDKIFALVGLSEAAGVNVDRPPISYMQPLSDTQRVWTAYMLRSIQKLDVLDAVNRYQTSIKGTSTQTWVPDFMSTDVTTRYHGSASALESLQATRSCPAHIDFRDEGKVLGLQGHVVGRIAAVGIVSSTSSDRTLFGFRAASQLHSSQAVYRSWEATFRLRKTRMYRATGEDIWDAYWQTLLFGGDDHEPRNDEEKASVRAEFDDFYQTHMGVTRYFNWLLWWRHLWFLVYATIFLARFAFGKFSQNVGLNFHRRVVRIGGRRAFRTESGYIGVGAQSTKVGDQVALFEGGPLPIVVRAEPGHGQWTMVGTSYVHGIMHGEAWKPEECIDFWFV